MKKILATLLFAAATVGAVQADNNERPVTLDKLPAKAQEFLKTHFGDLTFAYAVEETNFLGKEYDVCYTDRTEVEFRTDGEWTKVERRYAPVPDAVVPAQILAFVKEHNPQARIMQIDRDRRDWEVELDNGIELKFDLNYKLIGYDD